MLGELDKLAPPEGRINDVHSATTHFDDLVGAVFAFLSPSAHLCMSSSEPGVEVEDLPAQALDKNGKHQSATNTSEKLSKKKGKDDDSEFTEEEKKKRKQRRAEAGRAHGKYRNTHSDALSVVNALWAYEKAENREEFCKVNYLHAKTMQEMAKLRQQLSQLVVQYSLDAGAQSNEQYGLKDGSGLTKEYLLDCERAWHYKDQVKLNMNQEMVLQQAICAGKALAFVFRSNPKFACEILYEALRSSVDLC